MRQRVDTEIGEVDDAIGGLVRKRRQCTDPVDILLTDENIDQLLDDRLRLMRTRDGERPVAWAGR